MMSTTSIFRVQPRISLSSSQTAKPQSSPGSTVIQRSIIDNDSFPVMRGNQRRSAPAHAIRADGNLCAADYVRVNADFASDQQAHGCACSLRVVMGLQPLDQVNRSV